MYDIRLLQNNIQMIACLPNISIFSYSKMFCAKYTKVHSRVMYCIHFTAKELLSHVSHKKS